ncbi:MAG: integrase arm-type DNA-binding domain-containing protein [Alphaproteobacteria bacterium]
MQANITKRVVDCLEGVTDKEATLWDENVKGFGVRARLGGTLTYIVRYRPGGGGRRAPLRTYTIGRHGSPWTPDSARAEAKRILALVIQGVDPAGDRASARLAPLVADLAHRFLSEHVRPKRKPRTAEEYERLISLYVLPSLGQRRVVDVLRNDVAKLHYQLRDTPYQANRLLAVLRKMFTLAERWGMRGDGSNPARHIDKYAERPRERMLSGEELAKLGQALRNYHGWPHAKAAILLLLFTGARRSEILGLRWDWIDFERGEASLPDSKTGAKILELPPVALELLARLWPDGYFVPAG